MKMLLASNDMLALQPVAKRLVASGIPIALEKLAGIPSYLEVWIQRDSDFSLARTLLPTKVFPPAAAQSPADPLGSGRLQLSGASTQSAPIVTSNIERWLWRLR